MKGKIIAIEGIDGSGKNTQATALHKFLASKGFNCQIIHLLNTCMLIISTHYCCLLVNKLYS